MQTVLAVRGVVRRWSGLTTLVMLAAIVVLPRLAKLLPTELAINGTRMVPVTHYMRPNAGWDYFGFMMNGGSPPSPRGPRLGNGGANLAAGLAAATGDLGHSDPALSWTQTGKGTGPAKVSVRAASASGATVTIEIPGVQTEQIDINGTQYTKLTIPGAMSTGFGVGKAEVPSIPVLLARPTGSTVTFSILNIQTETLHVARVFPVQPPLKSGEQAGPLVVDNSFYASDVEYPSSRLSSPSLATWRDLDVVNVHVYPVVVRPAQHEVIVTSRITFRVNFSGGSYPRRVASWMQPMYRRLIQNYDNLRFTTPSIDAPGTKCLMFCYDAYAGNSALNGLRDTMSMLGDSTELIRVGGGTGGMDTADIKDTIIARYVQEDSVLRWVFLVGEFDQIPPKADYSRPEWCDSVPFSDYWYSDLTYGLPDFCDNYPEVGIARLSPQSSAGGDNDLTRQVTKIMNYMMGREMTGMCMTGGWLDTITLVAHEESFFSEAIRAVRDMDLSFHDYKRDTIMGCWGEFDNEDVKGSVGKGTGVLIYHGHGDWDRWLQWDSTNPSWTTGEVDLLGNQHTPVVLNLGCYCGDLSHATCLSEKWMRKRPDQDGSGYGAVASLGSTDEGVTPAATTQCSAAVRAIGDIDTVHGLLRDYPAPILDLGGIKMLMDADVASKWDGDQQLPEATKNIYSYMWLGNPAMQVWSGGAPEAAEVTYPSWIPTGPQTFPVTVRIGTDYVEGAQVCIRKDGEFYIVGTTDAYGEVTFSLDVASEGTIHVAASKGHCVGQPHTPMLPYFGTSYAGANGPQMTYPNWGRKLVRGPGNTLHAVYTGDGSVFYTQSINGDGNWTTPELVGAGSCPAIALHEVWSGLVPWVVYLDPDSSIVRAIRSQTSPYTWGKATIFQSSSADGRAGAPSLATGYFDGNPVGNVTYPVYDTSDTNCIFFNSFTSNFISLAETLDVSVTDTCCDASVAVTPLNRIHVAWTRGQSVNYRECVNSVWSDQVPISQPADPNTEPASHPSMESYGEYVYCVWRGPDSLGNYQNGDIWRRARWLDDSVYSWRPVANQSQSPDRESDFPVMTTNFVALWHEQVSKDNFDIWGRFLPDTAAQPFFQTSLLSRYPQVESWCGWSGPPGTPQTPLFRCWTVWTEQEDFGLPKCTLGFGWKDCDGLPTLGKGLGPCVHKDYELGLYYAAALGQPEQSPYCLSRGGFAQFESWNTDTSATGLTYQLPYLNPIRTYRLCAVLYHEGPGTWKADLRCDSGPWVHAKLDPHVPDTVWIQVPKESYRRDAQIVVELSRASGDYVSLAELKLFQIEEETRGDGGVQSWGTGMTFVTRLHGCSPNPFTGTTTISYELGNAGSVTLTLHDVTGRVVRSLTAGPQTIGFHSTVWDGKDARGRKLPAGVYFCRMQAGGTTATRRITLTR